MVQPNNDERYAILYVDDEPKSLKCFARAFRDKFKVLCATNAADGYRLLEEHRDEIALLMIDQRMPGEKGVEFLQRARQLHPKAVRILTTAYSDFDAIIDAVNSAAIYKYVTKPWNIPELESILEEGCESFAAQRERDLLGEAQVSAENETSRDGGSEDLQTPEQLARYLNVNRITVYRLVTGKKMPAFKVGNQWRFKKEMVDAWLLAKSKLPRKKAN